MGRSRNSQWTTRPSRIAITTVWQRQHTKDGSRSHPRNSILLLVAFIPNARSAVLPHCQVLLSECASAQLKGSRLDRTAREFRTESAGQAVIWWEEPNFAWNDCDRPSARSAP